MAIQAIYRRTGALVLCYGLAVAASIALAIPILSFFLVLFTFGLGIIPMVVTGFIAVFGPLALLIHAAVVWMRKGHAR